MMHVAITFVTRDKLRFTNCVKLVTAGNEGMATPICVSNTAFRPMASNAVTFQMNVIDGGLKQVTYPRLYKMLF